MPPKVKATHSALEWFGMAFVSAFILLRLWSCLRPRIDAEILRENIERSIKDVKEHDPDDAGPAKAPLPR